VFALVTPFLSWLGSFLGGPFIKAALAAYQAKLSSENTAALYASTLAAKAVDLEIREAELQNSYRIATIGKWYTPDNLMGYSVAIYFGKLLVYDKVLALGSTDSLAGWAALTANLIVSYYFAKVGIMAALKIWKMK